MAPGMPTTKCPCEAQDNAHLGDSALSRDTDSSTKEKKVQSTETASQQKDSKPLRFQALTHSEFPFPRDAF